MMMKINFRKRIKDYKMKILLLKKREMSWSCPNCGNTLYDEDCCNSCNYCVFCEDTFCNCGDYDQIEKPKNSETVEAVEQKSETSDNIQKKEEENEKK